MKRLSAFVLVAASAAAVASFATPASAGWCFTGTSEEHVIYSGPLTRPVTVDVPTKIDLSDCV